MTNGAPLVVCMGEILIDFLAEPKGKGLVGAEAFRPNPGGAPANVAVGLARLGIPAGFIGMVGNDDFGTLLRATLTNENVDTRSLATSTEQPTTLAFVALDPGGVPSFVFYRHPGADLSICPDDVDWSVFDRAIVFHCGSLSLVDDPARETTHACLRQAKAREIAVSYDPNFRPALWPDQKLARERMLEPLEFVTILKASADELRLMSGEDDVRAGCAALADQGPEIIVVTEGSSGMFLWSGGQTAEVSGEKIEVVDTTGCGDASVAGLLTYVVDFQQRENVLPPFKELERALTFANHCAAITATKPGAIPSLPKRADVKHLLPGQS
jgi:fructokinase